VINEDDLKLFSFVETAEDAWAHVCAHYEVGGEAGAIDC
jgi:hypothetical protein